MKPKFKIGDRVKIKYLPKVEGEIDNCWINKPKNIQIINEEYVYVILHLNSRSKMTQTIHVKESDLELE